LEGYFTFPVLWPSLPPLVKLLDDRAPIETRNAYLMVCGAKTSPLGNLLTHLAKHEPAKGSIEKMIHKNDLPLSVDAAKAQRALNAQL
jgi:hypothetical protein